MQSNLNTVRSSRRWWFGWTLLITIALIAIACGSSTPEQRATQNPPAPASLACELSGPASGFALQAVPGIDPAPTAFDGVNTATCLFSEPIESVTVRLFTVGGPLNGFEAHIETTAVQPPSITIVFPLEFGGERKILSSLLLLGTYARLMEARTVGGEIVIIQTETNEVSTDVFLIDPPNATAFAPSSAGMAQRP